MARNIEVLRNYFLGKDPQLKETMADNSLRLIGIEGKHFILRTELLARLGELKNYVNDKDDELKEYVDDMDDEVKDYVDDRDRELQGTIDDVETGLGTEILNRQTEDLALGNRISNEILDRAAADTSLQGQINSEIGNRVSGDNALGNRISSLETWKNTTDFVLDEDLIQALSDYYTKAEVNQLISVIPRFDIEVVQSLPVQDISETTIYLVPSSDPQTRNDYDEFIYVSNQWEQIGSTAIDLSDYYTKTEVDTALSGKQNALTAGDNIKITSNVIDTKGTTVKYVTDPVIWDMDDGVYLVSGLLDYDGEYSLTLVRNQLLYVNSDREDNPYFKYWTLIDNNGMRPRIYAGRTNGTTGTYKVMDIKDIQDFTGTDGQSDGTSGLVPAPETTDDGKFLCADGTWQEAGGGSTITYGTTDLTPGVSPLAEGSFYFQFE
jgi:hypothetical protein